MKRLTIWISIFFIALSMPLAYFILRAYRGIEQEEKAELEYFATVLFDEIETELADLILREEQRSLDEYSFYLAPNPLSNRSGDMRSPLARLPEEPYLLGYLQTNPDGSFQTPLIESEDAIPFDRQEVVERLRAINELLSVMKIPEQRREEPKRQTTASTRLVTKETISNIADKYFDLSRQRQQKTYLGQNEEARFDVDLAFADGQFRAPAPLAESSVVAHDNDHLQVVVAPMQSIVLNPQEVLIFRRIHINQQVYRQGFVMLVEEWFRHLEESYFTGQPMAEFSRLRLELLEQSDNDAQQPEGKPPKRSAFSTSRMFPRPFAFLQATITCDALPGSSNRRILNVMRVLTGAIILVGLFAIYQSARAVVELSERRAIFVSSVTHELKTPLTNIQMYAEMLEQGIAPNHEREEDYFRIIRSESKRLSRLIENVLEFSKLERKQRRFQLQEGTFEEVIREVREIMQEKLQQEGVLLKVERDEIPPFHYDREVMVQILLNLLDNSLKFGKTSPVREITLRVQAKEKQIQISVADTGPGIPRTDLKKIFDDFYRVDNAFTRSIRGTGIGLALVKKYVTALGGTVHAANNDGSGCTVTIALPLYSGQ